MIQDKDFTLRLIRQLTQALEKLLLGKPEESLMQKELDFADAYRLLSAACDIQISQLVNDTITVRVRAPKLDLQLQTVF